MSIQPGCIPCIVNQAYNTIKLTEISDAEVQKQILFETMEQLRIHKNIKTAPHFSTILHSIVCKHADVNKIYREIKSRNIRIAKKYMNYLSHMIEASDDKLEMAVRASITGNTIDIAANPDFDIEKEINVITSNNINLDFLPKFKEDYQRANKILFIGDNYEEALFDMLLIKELLPKEIVFAVRSNEILNDITMEDAKNLEIDKLCSVIENGNIIAGIDLEECSDDFLALYNSADMIIAKGQGNYETLFNAKRDIYFMFKVKCDVIAEICGNPVGTSVLYFHNGLKN
ncbi:MAG: ARMT1-like domain-containing protein [Ignavibacteriaceae bacterium]